MKMEKIVNLAEMLRLEITDYLLPALRIQSFVRRPGGHVRWRQFREPECERCRGGPDTESGTPTVMLPSLIARCAVIDLKADE